MEKKVLSFDEFIFESYGIQLNEEAAERAGVFYIKSGASASKLSSDLGKKLGAESGFIYEIEIPSLGVLFFKEGETLTKSGIKITKKEKSTSDILKIGDKEIKDKGSIILSKEDVEKIKQGGKIKIEAANNGLLVLRRFGGSEGGLQSLFGKTKFAISQANDYIVNFTLGGDPNDETSRGAKWIGAWINKGDNNAGTANSVIYNVLSAMIKLRGGEVLDSSSISRLTKDVLEKNKIDEYAKRINDLLEMSKKGLLDSKYLINPSTVDYTEGIKELLGNYKKYTREEKKKIKISGEGNKAVTNYFNKVVSMWCDNPKAPEGYKEIDTLLPEISKILKDSFGDLTYDSGFESIDSATETLQENRPRGLTSRPKGNVGSEDSKQKEGAF
jgi:hypothetical protein